MEKLPSGYQRVQYIRSSGTQYIDTGYIPNQDSGIQTKLRLLSALAESTSQVAFGSSVDISTNIIGMDVYQGAYRVQYGKSNASQQVYAGALDESDIIFSLDKNHCVFNGEAFEFSYAEFTCPGPMYLFCRYQSGTSFHRSTVTFYYMKIYDDGTLVRDYIPCIDPTGSVGLYDLVEGKFYGNAGTGSFEAGPVLTVQEMMLTSIADAIRERDGTTAPIAAETFPERIRAIPGGIGTAARPTGWLELPEPVDDEMYLLIHIPENGSETIGFTVTCTEDYTVELGTVRYQLFVPASLQTVQSGTAYEGTLSAENFGDILGDGTRQAVVKISGAGIKIWVPSGDQAIVEIKCRLPNGTSVMCGANDESMALRSLRYFTWRGSNSLTAATSLFRNCSALTAVIELSLSIAKNTPYMFYSCTSLKTIPVLDMANALNMVSMFRGCTSLKTIPTINVAKATVMDYAFHGCPALQSLKLNSMVTDWPGSDFSLLNGNFTRAGLVELFESLPAITENHTITITGNPGASALTEADKAIAAQKNWTLVL